MKKTLFVITMLAIAGVIYFVDTGLGQGWAAVPAFIAIIAMIHSKK